MIMLTPAEYLQMKRYIEESCGIYLGEGKEYLIEARLAELIAETGSRSFNDFYYKAQRDRAGRLRDRIIDAMTTNETYWFRDEYVWNYLRQTAVPAMIRQAAGGRKLRIWSAAASTGQEPYSLLMLLNEAAVREGGGKSCLDHFEILATDISTSALFVAMAARYDPLAIERGLPADMRDRYFRRQGNAWVFDQELKKRVSFKRFNLQQPSFALLETFDLVLCRYVAIYFSEAFKQELYRKLAAVLKPGALLILGATESLRDYSDQFTIRHERNTVLNVRR